MAQEEKPIHLEIVDDENTLTETELRDLKLLASNYRAAKFGVTAVIGLGGFIIGLIHAWQFLSDYFKR